MILGPHHSAVLADTGVLYTFGRNSKGQLGLGNTKPKETPMQVREMADKVTMVSLGRTLPIMILTEYTTDSELILVIQAYV